MKYTLEPYTTPSSRYHCPNCNDRARTFVRYIDTETGEHLADHVGRCGRENNCGYHYKPSQYFQNEGIRSAGYRPMTIGQIYKRVFRPKAQESIVDGPLSMANAGKRIFRPKTAESIVDRPLSIANAGRRIFRPKGKPKTNHRPSTMVHGLKSRPLCISPHIVDATQQQYVDNNFVQYLLQTFGIDVTYELVCRYRIGTAKHWRGATVFWQIDAEGWVRTGKVMLYDTQTGKRVKKPFNHITWAHALLGPASEKVHGPSTMDHGQTTSDFKLRQCLFGEHLLKEFPGKQVAIVESEKTAIIASAYDDSFIWLACGSISNLNIGICKVLDGRRVTLYPDLGAYEKWTAKALQLEAALRKSRFTVSRILEDQATDEDRKQGLDLGDFLKRTTAQVSC